MLDAVFISKIDALVEHVEANKNAGFDADKARRQSRQVIALPDNDALLEKLAVIIAYSQNARSTLVSELLNSGEYHKQFQNFDTGYVASLNPCDVVESAAWSKISAIRQKTKVFQLVMAARAIKESSVVRKMNGSQIPKKFSKEADIADFWKFFKALKKELTDLGIPFLRSTTSLLHLLLEQGYDVAKPDTVVMAVAKKLGIVVKETGDSNFVKVVRVMQEYALLKGVRPSVVDLYFLTDGRQSDTRKYVVDGYIPYKP